MYKYTYSTVVSVNLIKKIKNQSFICQAYIMRPLTWCGKLDVALESKSLPTPASELMLYRHHNGELILQTNMTRYYVHLQSRQCDSFSSLWELYRDVKTQWKEHEE